KTGHTKSWADDCANYCCERELKNTLRMIEDGCAAGEAIHQPSTAHSFERVATRDGDRCGDGTRSGSVHQKCTDKNCRPGLVTEHEQCRERNSRWRPHRRCTRVQRCQHQSELASDEIGKCQKANNWQPRSSLTNLWLFFVTHAREPLSEIESRSSACK